MSIFLESLFGIASSCLFGKVGSGGRKLVYYRVVLQSEVLRGERVVLSCCSLDIYGREEMGMCRKPVHCILTFHVPQNNVGAWGARDDPIIFL